MFVLSQLLLATAMGVVPDAQLATTDIREAIQRSVPFIEEKGEWWIEEKKCVSCHRVNTMVFSLGAARREGFEVSPMLDQWFQWSIDKSLSKNDDGKTVGLGNKEGVAQLLLALGTTERPLARDDGSWPVNGTKKNKKDRIQETAVYWGTTWAALGLITSLPHEPN